MFRNQIAGAVIACAVVFGFAADTAKATGNAIKKATKKLTPDTTSAPCNDGSVETGKTKTTACIDHGGVKD